MQTIIENQDVIIPVVTGVIGWLFPQAKVPVVLVKSLFSIFKRSN